MSSIEEIQIDITEAKETVAKADRLERLHKNEDFKAVILEGYFKEEAFRLVGLKAHPAMQGVEHQANIMKAIDAIGGLQQHFSQIFMMANQAEEAIRQAEYELAEMAEQGEL